MADVIVPDARIEAAEEGFPQLFDYIDGANRPSLAMAAEDLQKEKQGDRDLEKGEIIHMTVPVVEAPSNDGWKTRFFLPKSYTLQTIPQPVNSNIVVSQTTPRKVAVLRYMGSDNDEVLNQYEVKLRYELDKKGKVATGPAEYAFYNPPFKPPFLRKNEVILPVE
ncbi:MAG: heme-binding protein [Vampirovibrionales bacterium]|nr:heme-binding protein [Vampirovibrionales bacterium]